MKIRFTAHAQHKFATLRRHGVLVSRRQVVQAVEHPDRIDHSRLPLLIAQRGLGNAHVLRVVYRIENETIVIITFYPGRKSQYEKGN